MIAATTAETGLRIGLVATAFGLGFRHGIDWDHIAALTDIAGSQDSGRRSMGLATLYALGHALVVFLLGVLAIVLSARIPAWLDDAMGRIVGATLLALGVFVIVSLVRHGREFRMRSRWMLVFAALRRATRWSARRSAKRRTTTPDVIVVTHEHEHAHAPDHAHAHAHAHAHDHGHDHAHAHDHGHAHAAGGPDRRAAVATRHRHQHHHVGTLPDDPFPAYGSRTAVAVGALHGIGGETPTQILLFLAASRAGGVASGVVLLVCFIAGLLASNSAVAFAAVFGFLSASRNFRVYATVSVATAGFSLVVGSLFLLGRTPLLPALGG
jgi:cytochrome c biogenesis protein CcdA